MSHIDAKIHGNEAVDSIQYFHLSSTANSNNEKKGKKKKITPYIYIYLIPFDVNTMERVKKIEWDIKFVYLIINESLNKLIKIAYNLISTNHPIRMTLSSIDIRTNADFFFARSIFSSNTKNETITPHIPLHFLLLSHVENNFHSTAFMKCRFFSLALNDWDRITFAPIWPQGGADRVGTGLASGISSVCIVVSATTLFSVESESSVVSTH